MGQCSVCNIHVSPLKVDIFKCTELVQPQQKIQFFRICSIKQVLPTFINNRKDISNAKEEEILGGTMEPLENEPLETISGTINSERIEKSLVPENEYIEKLNAWNRIPKLRYSLGYDRQARELCVSFLEAVGGQPPNEEDSRSHSYVVGILTIRGGQMEAQTSLITRAPHTIWEEALLFPMTEEESAEAMLNLTLRHCDRFSRHLVVGEITLSLANLGIPFGTAHWVDLRPPEKEEDCLGEVLLSLSYLPAASRLIVVIIKAKNIHSDHSNNLLGKDLSVRVILRHQSQKLKRKQTKRVKHKINPVWNEMFMFEVPQELLGDVSVEQQLLCLEPGKSNASRILGTCCLGVEWTGTGKDHWEDMMNNPRRQIAMWHGLTT
ncbi:hypothetical protein GDO86_008878 [Hymenochirus boettgeri]|uniref:C2 domain-containing protein n=1 Tax=Hymenochirus boettgeri TaxID=247094 RepID=A0A8T2J6S6_9PIPI|nr:hypothetical protein GDO86_008878 [Hymenochirus boettgeri]